MSFDDRRIDLGYAVACSSILRDGDTVVDVGCNTGSRINAVRDHLLQKHGIHVRTVGIDIHTVESICENEPPQSVLLKDGMDAYAKKIIGERESLDRFVLGGMENVRMDGTADVVTCVGFSAAPNVRRDAYRNAAALLKPGGIAVYQVRTRADPLRRMADTLGYHVPGEEIVAGFVFSTRVMSKTEAVEHAIWCVEPSVDRKCRHGRTAL